MYNVAIYLNFFLEFGNESTTETLAFCDNIEQHMQESGSINRYLAHLVFVGLPGSGKSTLIARLLKLAEVEEMLKACASTGVMNGVINVNVTEDILSEHPTGIANECEWQKVEHGISCLRMMGVEDDETEKNCTPEIHFEIRIQQDEDEQCQDSAGGVEADPEDNTTTQEVAAAKSGASPLPSEIPLPLMLSSESSSTAECPLPSASPSFPSEASENPSPKRKKRPVSAASRKPVSAKKVAGTRVKHQQHSSGRFNLHMIQDLLKKKGFDAVRPYLNNKSNLYLSDTGGQIEFQELLPLLVAGCAIFVFVFSLNLDISKPVRVSYRMKGTRGKVRHSNIYMSSLTIRESFLQTLASIDSMAGLFQSQTPSVAKHKPYVFVVGTHKDLVMEKHKKKAEKIIEAIDAELIALIKEHKYEDLVVFADNVSNRLLFAVDNTCENDIFSNIRARVMDLIHSSEEFHIQFPLSYLLASLDLEDSRDPFIRRKDFARNAKKYGIEKEDIDHLLHFLHSRIGQIRYFPVKEIKEIIVREPQALFNVVTYLIVQSFLLTADYAKYTEVQKGIYSFNSFTMDEFMLYSSYLKPEQVIHLLKELRIVAPFLDQKTGIEKYFIPCILNHLTECPKGLNKSIVQPLAITFDCGHCPKGMFGVLLHCIVTTKSRRLQWNLDINMIFKDQVSFKVGKYDDVITLKFCTTHLEVSCHPVKVSVRDKALSMVKICNTVRSMLSSGIEQARVSLRYSPDKTRHDFGLVCSKCGTVHKVLQEGPQHLVGMYSKKGYQDLPESGSYWFGSKSTCRYLCVTFMSFFI